MNRRAIANLELQLRVLKNGDRVNDPLVADIERWRVEAKDMETEIATLRRRMRLAAQAFSDNPMRYDDGMHNLKFGVRVPLPGKRRR